MSNLMVDLLEFFEDLATMFSRRDGYIKNKSGRLIATLPPLPKPPVMAKATPGGKRI